MSDHLVRTIADMEQQINDRERQIAELKRSANVLCQMAGIAPKYEAIADPAGGGPRSMTVKDDQFVNKPLNSAVKEYLTMRRASGLDGPAAAEEIHSALELGGFEFDTRDKAAAMNNLKISLGKSSHTFKRLNNGKYGLNERQVRPQRLVRHQGPAAASQQDKAGRFSVRG